MAKITLTDLTSLANDDSATNSINENFQAVEDYINLKSLSRDADGNTNTIQNDLDMNNHSLLNVTNINDIPLGVIGTGLVDQVGYAEEWAISPEDSLVSVDAGGNGVDEYSSLHHAAKASASASAASASASAASASASAASASASAASVSEANAEAAFDTFDDIWLGPKASPPTLDNDGDPLAEGALYLNTTSDVLYYYSGGTWVAAYLPDGAYASPSLPNTWSAPQTGTTTTDNDLSFDLSVTNNFFSTPTGAGTLTFTNHTSGQSGFVLLDNSGGYAISAAATTKITATDLAAISVAGTYLISYFDNGTNTYVVTSGNLG